MLMATSCKWFGAASDITERKLAEEALRESQAKLEAAFSSMNEAIFIADAAGQLADFNDEFVRYYRFTDRKECAKTVVDWPKYLEAYFPDGTPAPLEAWALPRALRGECSSNTEYMLRRKDTGETWWGSYSFGPIKNDTGRIVGAVVAAREITGQKLAEEAFRRSQKTFLELIERAPFGIYVVDSQFCIATMNAGSQGGAFRNVRPVIGRDLGKPCVFSGPSPWQRRLSLTFGTPLKPASRSTRGISSGRVRT